MNPNIGRPDFWAGRRVLVTGATGIVGYWLVKALVDYKAHVVALVRNPNPRSALYYSGLIDKVEVAAGRLEDFHCLHDTINRYEIEVVFHLGAQTIVQTANRAPLQTFEANVRGTYNLLEACRDLDPMVSAIVIASSDKAYGDVETLPYTETMPLNGKHPYDVSKSCTDLISISYHHSYGLPVSVTRCGNIYGGCDLNWSRIVPGTIRAFLDGDRPVIRSDGQALRDYIYVKDVVRAYIAVAEQLSREEVRGEAFNFSTDKPLRVLEVVKAVQDVMACGHIEPDVQNTASREIAEQHLSSSKAHEILNWSAQFDLREGLQETVDWYRHYLSGDAATRG